MGKRLSVYLDLIRILASIAVLLSHLLPAFHLGPPEPVYGHDAVVFFFVLSGFVIAFVCDTRETRPRAYATARLARLWSVAVPALLFGLVLHALLGGAGPFADGGKPQSWLSALGASLVTLIFCGEGWGGTWRPPYDSPFWSLNYEAWYYACFGAFYFLSGRRRWVGTLALALLAGPRVVTLAPCWLAGAALYHLRARLVMRPAAAWVLFACSLAAFATLNHFGLSKISRAWLRALTNGQSYHLGSSQGLIGDYLLTLAVFANFTAAANLPVLLKALDYLRRPVAAAASLTLSVYLYHMPLLTLAVWLFGLSPESGLRGAGAATAVMLPGIVLLWLVTDRQRWRLRAWLESLWPPSLRTPRSSPAGRAQS